MKTATKKSRIAALKKANESGKTVETLVMIPSGEKTQAIVKTHATKQSAKAKAKTAKAKAKAKDAKAKAAKAKADAKAKARQAEALAKAKEKQQAATDAQHAQAEALNPRDVSTKNKTAVHRALVNFMQSDLGLTGSEDAMEAYSRAFHKNATSIKLVPLSKCAHAIGLALGAISASDLTVTDATCRACYGERVWRQIRDIYSLAAKAFRSYEARVSDGHRTGYSMRAVSVTTKKGNTVLSGSITRQAKIAKDKVTATAVELTKALEVSAIQTALTRFKNYGSCAILNKPDMLRVIRHFTSGKGDKRSFKLGDHRPAWMTPAQGKELETRINANTEKTEVILSWLKGQAEAYAKAKA